MSASTNMSSNSNPAAVTKTNADFRSSRYLALAAMLFAVAMLFIDQTIVSIAAPSIQQELGLSDGGVQWIVNGYLLSLSAFFAFGGRLSDIVGHKRMVLIGIVVFAVSSALCGFTPKGQYAETWIIVFRVLQGFGGAIMFPASLALIVAVFPVSQRGRALALFFGLTGAFTAIGPIAGGYLTEWTWRSIFWVNVPVAILAFVLTCMAKVERDRTAANERMDWLGAVLIAVGMGLTVLGFQQSSQWGWGSALTWGCITAGIVVLAIFGYVETKVTEPLIKIRIFKSRAFSIDNGVLFLASAAFLPVFFFISLYAQISLGYSASNSGLFLMWFFIGFVVAAQFGGRALDRIGVKRPMILGCAIATVGFSYWAINTPSLSANSVIPWIIVTGAGIGLMLGPANTDALNRAINASYGEVSGVTQTIRYFGSSVGMALLGTLMLSVLNNKLVVSLTQAGVPSDKAAALAQAATNSTGSSSGGAISQLPPSMQQTVTHIFQVDFAAAIQYVFYAMAAIMAVALLVAIFHPGGKFEQNEDALTGGDG